MFSYEFFRHTPPSEVHFLGSARGNARHQALMLTHGWREREGERARESEKSGYSDKSGVRMERAMTSMEDGWMDC